MAIIDITAETIEHRLDAQARAHFVGVENAIPANQRLNQLQAALQLGPYCIQAGQPVNDSGFGVSAITTCYIDSGGVTAGSGFPAPSAAVTGADYRFLPQAAYTGSSSGRTRWFPVGGSATTYPQMAINTISGTADPVISSGYSYESAHVRVARPAFTVNGNGFFELLTANGSEVNYTKAAFVMVLVPHAGAGGYYPLYDSGKTSNSGRRLAINYRKGVIEIVTGANTGRLLSHQVFLDHSEPIILGFSYDGPAKIGRFVCADKRRVSRTFNVNGIVGMDMNAYIGARTTTPGGSTTDLTKLGDLDVLEVDMWLNKSLTQQQLESVVQLLACVYQVGPQ